MNRSLGTPSLKRRRPETDPPGLVDAERAILDSIKSKKDLGIWVRDIKIDTKLTDHVVNKSLKSLTAKKLVKEVVNIQNKGKKHFMAVEFEPSKEISGGEWYIDGNLDKELINVLQQLCLRYMRAQKVATLEGVHNELKKNRVVNFDISAQQVAEILNSMVLDNEIIEVKSTGLGDYYSIPIGKTCYRVASGARVAKGSKVKVAEAMQVMESSSDSTSATLSTGTMNDMYLDVVGGVKKGRVYGLGTQASGTYPDATTPRPRGASSGGLSTAAAAKEIRAAQEEVLAAREEARVAHEMAEAACEKADRACEKADRASERALAATESAAAANLECTDLRARLGSLEEKVLMWMSGRQG